MWESILLAAIKDIVVPEISAFIKKHYEETGTFPTKEELEVRVTILADKIIASGNDFLNRKVDGV